MQTQALSFVCFGDMNALRCKGPTPVANKRIFNFRRVCWSEGQWEGAWMLGRDWPVELAVDVKGTEKKSPLVPWRPE